ncbi:MAG: hypothetical protein KatS3mg118_3545 [Paracoccaceae bacterium]|nr:MAG: hypothetical protein KatS3mg118_3545 [Paracoccaceae bacterium]
MLLEVEALDLRYGATHAVRGVSLSVAEGEIVAVLGANGAGKSSLMRAIAGAAAASGRIRLAGSDISRMPAARRVRAGLVLVPEGRQIFVSNDGSRRTCWSGPIPGATARSRAISRRCWNAFPTSPPAAASPPRCCRAANSRCWPSAGR